MDKYELAREDVLVGFCGVDVTNDLPLVWTAGWKAELTLGSRTPTGAVGPRKQSWLTQVKLWARDILHGGVKTLVKVKSKS